MFLIIIAGLIAGSFVNAAVWRLHEHKPIVNDRSECPNCHHKLVSKDLVPLFSYLALKGHCRYCHKPIAIHYPLVELLTAVAFTWSYLAWPFSDLLSKISFGFWLVILVGLIILAVHDLYWLILPLPVMYILLGLAVLSLVVHLVLGDGLAVVGSYLVAAGLAGFFFLSLHMLGKGRWLGGGDVILAVLIGLLLGSSRTLVGLFIGFGSAALISIGLMAARLKRRKDTIPFGPFLIFGLFVAMLYGQAIFNWYLNLFVR